MRNLLATPALMLCFIGVFTSGLNAARSRSDEPVAIQWANAKSPELLDAAYAAWQAGRWTELDGTIRVLTGENPCKGALWCAQGDAGALYNMACCFARGGMAHRPRVYAQAHGGDALQRRLGGAHGVDRSQRTTSSVESANMRRIT